MENVLIVGAHYDDAELGCGGTAAKLSAEGKKVYKLTLTNNVTHFEAMNIHVEYETSIRESALACKILGVQEITSFRPVPCNQLFYTTEMMQRIESLLYQYHIDTVFIHYADDLNQDHISASKLCLTASRHCDNIFFYQSNLYILPQAFTPTYFVDITDYAEKKRAALMQYTGDHNRFHALFETNMERNRVWGYANHVAYSEGFVVQKCLRR